MQSYLFYKIISSPVCPKKPCSIDGMRIFRYIYTRIIAPKMTLRKGKNLLKQYLSGDTDLTKEDIEEHQNKKKMEMQAKAGGMAM